MERSWLKAQLISIMVLMVLMGFHPVCMASEAPPLYGEGCTAFGVAGVGTYDGFALIGGNSDKDWWSRGSLVYRVPEKGYRYIGVEVPINGVIRAINEKGFCLIRNALSPDKVWLEKLGKRGGIADTSERFIKECATVDDAIKILQSFLSNPAVAWSSFIFADAKGKVSLVQIIPGSLAVVEPDQHGWVSVSNHMIVPEFEQYDKEYRKEGTSSWHRYQRTLELRKTMEGKKADPYTLMEFLADTKNLDVEKGNFKSISAHGKNSGTIFACVMQPALKIFWYCYGPADGKVLWYEGTWGRFVPFALPQMLPGQYVTEDGVVSPEYPYPYAREHLRLRPLQQGER